MLFPPLCFNELHFIPNFINSVIKNWLIFLKMYFNIPFSCENVKFVGHVTLRAFFVELLGGWCDGSLASFQVAHLQPRNYYVFFVPT